MLKEHASTNFSRYPLLWLSIFFALGVLASRGAAPDWKICLFACLSAAPAAVLPCCRRFAPLLVGFAFFAAGGLCYQIENRAPAPDRLKRIYEEGRIGSNEPIEIEGVLRGKPESAAGGFHLVLAAEKISRKNDEIKARGRVRLFVAASSADALADYERLALRHGTRIRAACALRRDDAYLNPGVVRRTEILDQKEIDAVGTAKSPLLIENLGDEASIAPAVWIYERREDLIGQFRSRFDVSTAGVLIGSLLGNENFLDRSTAEVFRASGTFHSLVISGLHITFIGGLALLAVRRVTGRRSLHFLVTGVFLWSYTIAVGAELPVVRASATFTVFLLSQSLFRCAALLNALGASALILLVWRPADLLTPSFQLTFASMAAIVGAALPLVEKLREIGEWRPSAERPLPPDVPRWLQRFCETLYWRENVWRSTQNRSVWSARLFKAPHFGGRLETRHLQPVVRYLFEGVLVSTVVQLWLLPLSAYYFNRVSPAAILLNLWVGFFLAAESFAALAALAAAQISENLAFPLIKLTEILNRLLLFVPRLLVDADWASFRVPLLDGRTAALYFLYFAPIIMLAAAVTHWRPFRVLNLRPEKSAEKKRQTPADVFASSVFIRAGAAVLALSVLLIVIQPFGRPRADGRLRLDFLDVGQGDAVLITFPSGETMLVDGGGRPDYNRIRLRRDGEEAEVFEPDTSSIGEAVVSRFLWANGRTAVDYILATHADADHLQGLIDVARNFRARAAFFGRMPEKNEDFARLSDVLRKNRVPQIKLARGDALSFGAARVEVLSPAADDGPDAVSDNDRSLVLRVSFGGIKFLLTGDIEKATEKILAGKPEDLEANVVKVAHHGSRTSSIEEFVKATKAEYAVISVGRDSPYGHPHREVVERWRNAGAKVLRTGERGTVTVSTDGRDLKIERFLP